LNHSGHAAKVAQLIHHKLALMLPRVLRGDVGLVTLLGVSMSPDERVARVRYSVMGSAAQWEAAASALAESVPRLRQDLRRVLRIRRIPDLVFVPERDNGPDAPVPEDLEELL